MGAWQLNGLPCRKQGLKLKPPASRYACIRLDSEHTNKLLIRLPSAGPETDLAAPSHVIGEPSRKRFYFFDKWHQQEEVRPGALLFHRGKQKLNPHSA